MARAVFVAAALIAVVACAVHVLAINNDDEAFRFREKLASRATPSAHQEIIQQTNRTVRSRSVAPMPDNATLATMVKASNAEELKKLLDLYNKELATAQRDLTNAQNKRKEAQQEKTSLETKLNTTDTKAIAQLKKAHDTERQMDELRMKIMAWTIRHLRAHVQRAIIAPVSVKGKDLINALNKVREEAKTKDKKLVETYQHLMAVVGLIAKREQVHHVGSIPGDAELNVIRQQIAENAAQLSAVSQQAVSQAGTVFDHHHQRSIHRHIIGKYNTIISAMEGLVNEAKDKINNFNRGIAKDAQDRSEYEKEVAKAKELFKKVQAASASAAMYSSKTGTGTAAFKRIPYAGETARGSTGVPASGNATAAGERFPVHKYPVPTPPPAAPATPAATTAAKKPAATTATAPSSTAAAAAATTAKKPAATTTTTTAAKKPAATTTATTTTAPTTTTTSTATQTTATQTPSSTNTATSASGKPVAVNVDVHVHVNKKNNSLSIDVGQGNNTVTKNVPLDASATGTGPSWSSVAGTVSKYGSASSTAAAPAVSATGASASPSPAAASASASATASAAATAAAAPSASATGTGLSHGTAVSVPPANK
jgi:hypothetical protein